MPGIPSISFTATDDADWAQTIEFTDDTTNAAWTDAADLEFTLNVKEKGRAVLVAGTADGTLTRPEDNEIAWRFTAAQMATLCPGNTYKVGCVAEDGDGAVTQIFVGDLAVIDGGIA